MSYEPTVQDIQGLMEQQPMEAPESLSARLGHGIQRGWQKAGEYAEDVGLPSLIGHALSAPLKLSANVADLMLEPGRMQGINFPKVEVPSYINPENLFRSQSTPMSEAMGTIGDVIGSGGGELQLAKGVNQLFNIGAKTPLIKRMLAGLGQGYATGSEEMPGGRLGAAGVGAVAPGVAGISKSKIGQRASDVISGIEDKYQGLYRGLLGEAKKIDKGSVRIPSTLSNKTEDITSLFKTAPARQKNAIKRFESNPSIENAHTAQSNLGAIKAKLKSQQDRGIDIGSEGRATIRAADDLQKRIRGAMHQWFSESGRPDLSSQYRKITTQYAQEAAPYRPFMYQEHEPKELATKLLTSKDFSKTAAAKELPGFGVRKFIEPAISPAKKIGGTAALIGTGSALGLPGIYYLKELLKDM
ncbi:MAG: hypothetical protein AB7F29_13805 [Candidatus Nitrosocosmicus sp.]